MQGSVVALKYLTNRLMSSVVCIQEANKQVCVNVYLAAINVFREGGAALVRGSN
jgi:hypothetical protein